MVIPIIMYLLKVEFIEADYEHCCMQDSMLPGSTGAEWLNLIKISPKQADLTFLP